MNPGSGHLYGQRSWRSGETRAHDAGAADDGRATAARPLVADSNGSVVNGGRRMLLATGQKITIKFSAKAEPSGHHPGHHPAPSLAGSLQVYLPATQVAHSARTRKAP